MAIRIRDLASAGIGDLPDSCRTCLRWERSGPSAPWHGRSPWQTGSNDASGAQREKREWWSRLEQSWGPPGKAAYADGCLIGYALFAPLEALPWAGDADPDERVVLLGTVWVAPEHRASGTGKALLQASLAEAHRHGARILDAYGVRGPAREIGGCLLPEGFLLAQGFVIHQDHYRYPLLRVDLRRTARWQESVGQALREVGSVIRPRVRVPVPARLTATRRPPGDVVS